MNSSTAPANASTAEDKAPDSGPQPVALAPDDRQPFVEPEVKPNLFRTRRSPVGGDPVHLRTCRPRSERLPFPLLGVSGRHQVETDWAEALKPIVGDHWNAFGLYVVRLFHLQDSRPRPRDWPPPGCGTGNPDAFYLPPAAGLAASGGTGNFTSMRAPAVTATSCVWVTSLPLSIQRARTV